MGQNPHPLVKISTPTKITPKMFVEFTTPKVDPIGFGPQPNGLNSEDGVVLSSRAFQAANKLLPQRLRRAPSRAARRPSNSPARHLEAERLNRRGIALDQQNRWEEAAAQFRRALQASASGERAKGAGEVGGVGGVGGVNVCFSRKKMGQKSRQEGKSHLKESHADPMRECRSVPKEGVGFLAIILKAMHLEWTFAPEGRLVSLWFY